MPSPPSSIGRPVHRPTLQYYKKPSLLLLFLLLAVTATKRVTLAFEYVIDDESDPAPSLSLTDIETSIAKLKTVFINAKTQVDVIDLQWIPVKASATVVNGTVDSFLFWTTSVDGVQKASGNTSLSSFGRILPKKIPVGEIFISSSKKHTITVTLAVDNSDPFELTKDVVGIQPWVSLIPLIIVLVLAATTQMVRDWCSGSYCLLIVPIVED
jgi:hypothetical protein